MQLTYLVNNHTKPYFIFFNYFVFKTGWTLKYSWGIWVWTMTKSLIIMKSPIKADFQQQKPYAELIQLITESQGMIFKRK